MEKRRKQERGKQRKQEIEIGKRKQEKETGNRKREGERKKKEGVSHPREVRGKSTGKAREGQKGAPWKITKNLLNISSNTGIFYLYIFKQIEKEKSS